jgi:hypothetical protein
VNKILIGYFCAGLICTGALVAGIVGALVTVTAGWPGI